MIAIHEALTDKRDVKVVTAKGRNVNNIGFYKEQPDKPGDDKQRKMDDMIIATTKLQGKAWRQAMLGDYGDYEAAIPVQLDCRIPPQGAFLIGQFIPISTCESQSIVYTKISSNTISYRIGIKSIWGMFGDNLDPLVGGVCTSSTVP
ncbi:hypothetical protein L873DRAFT_1799813, partial [Choiromyces venosus 120613-1]